MKTKRIIHPPILTLLLATLLFHCQGSIAPPAARVYNCAPDVITNVDTNASSWITDNFGCMTIGISDTNYVFTTTSQPEYSSVYWGSSSSLFQEIPTGRTASTNLIAAKNYTLTIPATPVPSGSTTTTGPMGVAINGVVIYNNAAGSGDNLTATEFDKGEGHPDSSSTYHYHIAPANISVDDEKIIGIALDGYAIYGLKDVNGSTPTDLDANHGHIKATSYYPNGIYHYHYSDDTTATIQTLLGSTFKGAIGTVSSQ